MSVLEKHPEDHGHEHHHEGFLRKYVFSQDHKVIGLQYLITSLLFLFFGFTLMLIMRWQLGNPGQPVPFIGGWLGQANAPGGIVLGLPEPRLAFDGSGGQVSELLGACLRSGGELVVYGATSRQPAQISADQLIFRDIRVRGFWLHRWVASAGVERVNAELDAPARMNLREHVVARFTLEQWPDAQNHLERQIREHPTALETQRAAALLPKLAI